MIYQKNTSC